MDSPEGETESAQTGEMEQSPEVKTTENNDAASDAGSADEQQQQATEDAGSADEAPLDSSMQDVSVLEDKQVPVLERMQRARGLIVKERDELQATPLREYSRIDQFRTVTTSTEIVLKHFQDDMKVSTEEMSKLRKELTSMNGTLEQKLREESIMNWKNQIKTHTDGEMAIKLAEAQTALAEASKQFAKFEELAAELEVAAAEAVAEAEQAMEQAKEAQSKMEGAGEDLQKKRQEEEDAARKAEEERKQREEEEEEERRRKEEEERQRKEEEERKKREEEQKNENDEERAERERKRKEEEEERRKREQEEEERRTAEAEKLDPKNWQKWVFSVEAGDTGVPLGCVIKAMPGSAQREHFSVECIPQLAGDLPLSQNEDLVSNIIKINHTADNFSISEPLSISLPHLAPRNPARDTVIKMQLSSGRWRELATSDIAFEDIKDYKFVECRADRVATFAVITRTKVEKHTVHKRGGKVTSGVDGRVCFVVKPNVFKVSTPVTLEVQPVDSTTISDLHSRHPECTGLVATSPMVRFNTPLKRYTKKVMVNVPLPSPNSKNRRPKTAVDRQQNQEPRQRPMSAFGSTLQAKEEEETSEQVLILTQGHTGSWVMQEGISLTQPKNKDIVMFELDKPIDRFIVVRCKEDVVPARAEKTVCTLEETLYDRHVQLFLRQRSEDASQVILMACVASKLDSTIRRLSEKGFDYGPSATEDIIMREGQEITVRFRGNIKEETDVQEMKMVFNSNIKTKVNFRVDVKDTFAQKSIDCYRGFVRCLTTGLVPNKTPEEATKEGKPVEMVPGLVLAGELLVNLPKPEPEASKPIIQRVPVQVKTDGFVNEDLLHFVASELGEEWKKVAQFLSVRRSRIQAIERNNVNKDTETTIFDTLITWLKRVPKSANKVDMLIHALVHSGRIDLAEIVRDKERDFKREVSLSARDSYLKKGFVRVCQAPHVVSDWKFLAKNLDLSDDVIDSIEGGSSSLREQCYQMLVNWQETSNSNATPAALVGALRRCRYNTVADQTADVMKGAR